MLPLSRPRLTELLGSFLLGGGLVALAYELAGLSAGASAPAPAPDAESASVQAGRDDDAASASGSVYADADEGEEEGLAGDAAEGASAPGELAASGPAWMRRTAEGSYSAFPPVYAPELELSAEDEAAFPQHALITGAAAIIRETTDLESKIVGVVRAGTRLRVDSELSFGGGCSKGWHQVHPYGWICMNAGLRVGEAPPDDGLVNSPPPKLDEPMPYEYWRVNHDATPFFHRLPSFAEQDRADEAGQAWIAEHGREPMPTHPAARPEEVPAVVKEYLNAGYYVTVAGEAVKSQRYFLRTLRGVYARKYQLGQKEGSDFQGMLLPSGADDLPVYWILRETGMMQRKEPGSEVLVDAVFEGDEAPPSRRGLWPFRRKVLIGAHEYYEDDDGRVMRVYAVGKSRTLKRPPGVGADETWVHVDLSDQVLVAYEGDRPVFTTLVSTGREPGMTPIGVHRLQSKHIATSMRDQPIEDDAYSIEDVPWTQYFHNNVALHGAFWHGGFGLVRSHGCVNLSPADARWLFGFLHPRLPAGWHAMTPGVAKNGEGSAVVITE
ncbi:MAG: L,D-transpeptidase [Myxococcales bacterium]|nr:L,D-transpeptidase [Myxococcales bacterium]